MCGVVAAWDPAGLPEQPMLRAIGALGHRGPDAHAAWWGEQRTLFFGHTRLKILDTSDAANQPLRSPCGRWTLVYNGEIYNFRELRVEIGDRWPWRTDGDTEVLLAAWSVWGERCLDRLVGMFAFAVHDAEAHTLTLARDRFGIKPLYHVRTGTRRVFASEIPPLLPMLDGIEPDAATIRTYLELGLYDHGVDTFFAGVKAVAAGSLVAIDLRDGSETARLWYDLADHVADWSDAGEADLLEQADTLVRQAIRSHLVADVAVGLNVSGGVDSSMLVRDTVSAVGHAHLFTQDYPGYSELPWVRAVADGGTLHVAELDAPRIAGYVDATARAQAEPFGGVFVCGYNALYEMARAEGVTVLLDGNGVDELFLGYKRYHQLYVAAAASHDERQRRAAAFTAAWGDTPRPVPAGAAIDGTESVQPSAISRALRAADLRPIEVRDGWSDPVRAAAAADLLHAKVPRGLRFNDRVSMAHSRELRVPYLDHRLVEFAFGIPAARLMTDRGGKTLFRDLLARRTGPGVAYAPKRSVQSPQREWLSGPWRPWVESVLSSASFAERGWVDVGVARRLYDAYCHGQGENSFFVWQWLNLELWARQFVDARVAA